jgi:hypothetical protein
MRPLKPASHLANLSLDRRDVLGADMPLRLDPHGGDAGGAKVVFREEFVARWLAMPAAMKSLFASGASSRFWKPHRAAHMETATAGPALGGGWRLTPTRKFNGRTHGAFLRYAVAPVPELTRNTGI